MQRGVRGGWRGRRGTTDDGRFMFGSCVEDLLDCNPSATLFPAGARPCLSPSSLGDRGTADLPITGERMMLGCEHEKADKVCSPHF